MMSADREIPPLPPASLRLKVDTAALVANWCMLDAMSGSASAGAAVKADAYGLGVEQVAPALRAAGARQFFVAHWSEVPSLLACVPAEEIAVLHGPVTAAEAAFGKDTGVRPVINSLHQAALWLDAGGGPCDLMVDTGMSRLGIALEEMGNEAIGRLAIHTLHSHLASADEDVPQNAIQLARFAQAAKAIPAQYRSLANSAGIALGADYAFDRTRPGIALYGGVPRREFTEKVKQIAFPQTSVIQIRTVAAGERIGYNGIDIAQHDMRCATVAIGYADGYLRCWTGHGQLRFAEVILPVVGRISMDLAIINCAAAPDLREGDFLDVCYDIPAASAATGLSQYELLTGLGSRFGRSG